MRCDGGGRSWPLDSARATPEFHALGSLRGGFPCHSRGKPLGQTPGRPVALLLLQCHAPAPRGSGSSDAEFLPQRYPAGSGARGCGVFRGHHAFARVVSLSVSWCRSRAWLERGSAAAVGSSGGLGARVMVWGCSIPFACVPCCCGPGEGFPTWAEVVPVLTVDPCGLGGVIGQVAPDLPKVAQMASRAAAGQRRCSRGWRQPLALPSVPWRVESARGYGFTARVAGHGGGQPTSDIPRAGLVALKPLGESSPRVRRLQEGAA